MSDLEWFNERLTFQLNQEENQSYKHLIEAAIKSEDIKIKCDLHVLLMHHSTQHIVEENLQKAITEFYCSDKDLDAYLDKIIFYNPKFGTISISAFHRMDMQHESTLEIEVPVRHHENIDKQFEEVRRVEKKIKEVLTMILVESKTIVP